MWFALTHCVCAQRCAGGGHLREHSDRRRLPASQRPHWPCLLELCPPLRCQRIHHQETAGPDRPGRGLTRKPAPWPDRSADLQFIFPPEFHSGTWTPAREVSWAHPDGRPPPAAPGSSACAPRRPGSRVGNCAAVVFTEPVLTWPLQSQVDRDCGFPGGLDLPVGRTVGPGGAVGGHGQCGREERRRAQASSACFRVPGESATGAH